MHSLAARFGPTVLGAMLLLSAAVLVDAALGQPATRWILAWALTL